MHHSKGLPFLTQKAFAAPPNAAPPNTSGTPEAVKKGTCSIDWDGFSLSACISDGFEWIIKNVLLGIAGWFLWLTSEMLNYVVTIGILKFSYLTSSELYLIWTIVRKIVSLFVVFVGLWLGFMYILGKEDKFEKYVPWVVIFALFINFSYPLARVAIDVSNVVALKVYVATFGPEVLKEGTTARSAGTVVKEQLGLTSVVKDVTGDKFAQEDLSTGLKGVKGVPASLMVVIFVFYTAYVFFMAALMLAIRTAILIFMIVMSPFLFVDSILPVLGDVAMKARTVFFSQLAVAPVFMIMLALSLKFMIVIKSLLGGKDLSTDAGSSPAIFMTILLMLVMLKITLKVTKDLSEKAGTSVSNALGKVGGFATTGALAVATGGAGLAARGALAGSGILARGTIGRAAGKLRDSAWVTNSQDSFVGRRVYDMSNSLAKSSYDLRNSSVVAGGLRNVGIKNIGEGGKLGYEETAEKKRQDILARAERIKTRYERDVVDANGNVLHRKGDVDVSGQVAFDRYVEKAGGARFVTEEQKKKTREALAEKQKERSNKYTQESDTLSTKEVSEYNSIQSPQVLTDANGNLKITSVEEQKATYIKELERDLKEYEKRDPELQGTIGRSLLKSIQEIKTQQLKEQISELQKEFTAIDSDIKNPDGTVSTIQNQRDQVLKELREKQKEVLREAQEKNPRRKSADAETLEVAKVDFEKQAKKSDEEFMKKVEGIVYRYQNTEGNNDAEKEKSRAKLLDGLDERMRTTVKQQLRNDGVLAPEKSTILGADGRPLDRNPTGQASAPAPTPATTPTSTTSRTNPAFFTPQPIDFSQLNTPVVARKNSQPTVDIDLSTLGAESAEQRAENILADGRPAVARTNKPPVTPLPSFDDTQKGSQPAERTTDWQGENTEIPAGVRKGTSELLAQVREAARKKIEREKETHG